jgi:23S rRNA (guanosine2251-2'-O)-methyltransferase
VLELLARNPSGIDTVFVLKGRRGKDTDAVLDLCRSAAVRFKLVDGPFLDRLWSGRHQGVVARLAGTGFSSLETVLERAAASPLRLALALDQVQDPGNAGTLARTLYAFGGAGLIIPRHNGVYLGPAAAKASAGALEQLAVSKAANLGQALDQAAQAGFTLYGAASRPLQDRAAGPADIPVANAFTLVPRFPALLVLGSEERGLRPTIAGRCSCLIHVPLARDFDSLNVAQAGAVILARFAALAGER